jgi:SAM-dependent methyltransferase
MMIADGRHIRSLASDLRGALAERDLSDAWTRLRPGLIVRQYRRYEAYVAHQTGKHRRLREQEDVGRYLRSYDERFAPALRERISREPLARRGAVVLCLGARQGTEVRVFLERGCFAVGIDLDPGPGNGHVLYGDFHQLVFPDGSVDLVYTNSLDHALALGRVFAEARRVLKEGGRLLVEATLGLREGGAHGRYEATAWDTVEDLVGEASAAGLILEARYGFDSPWPGHHLRFRPATPEGSGDLTASE